MTKERWDREREALRRLARVLAEEARGGLLEEAIDVVLDATRAEAGAAFASNGTSLDLVAERGLGRQSGRGKYHPPPVDLRPPIAAAARRAMSGRKSVYLVDLTAPRVDAEGRDDLLAHGFRSLLARAVKHQRQSHGVLVLVSKDISLFDASRLAFVETVAHMVGLAAERNKRAERELDYRTGIVELGRMSALGCLTGAAAYELKGPVAALGAQLATQEQIIARLRQAGPDGARSVVTELSQLLGDMKGAVAQLNVLYAQLASVSPQVEAIDRIDLSAVTRDTLSLVRGELRRRGLSLTEDYAPSCVTTGRRDQLVQIILNLIFHAADACALAGRPRPSIAVRTGIDGSRIVLSIDDTGPVIPPDELATMFQPFATKREGARNAGLGLSICSDLLAGLHGRIEVTNREEAGVSFRVELPRAADANLDFTARLGSTQPPPAESDLRRVLVVNDDESVFRSMRRALRPHDVRSAVTASEAEIALLDPSYLPHMVLCDLALPGMTGDMLHARIVAKRPQVAQRFVFLSAGPSSQRETDYLRASGCPTLLKPVDVREIWSLLNLATAPPARSDERPSNIPTETPPVAGPQTSRPRRRSGAPTLPPQ